MCTCTDEARQRECDDCPYVYVPVPDKPYYIPIDASKYDVHFFDAGILLLKK